MALSFGYELFQGYPVPEDGVSFGSVSINNITPLIETNGLIVGASLNLDSVTISLKGIPVGEEPFPEILADQVGQFTFTFRDKEYVVISTSRGSKLRVGTSWIYLSWSCTGLNSEDIKLSI